MGLALKLVGGGLIVEPQEGRGNKKVYWCKQSFGIARWVVVRYEAPTIDFYDEAEEVLEYKGFKEIVPDLFPVPIPMSFWREGDSTLVWTEPGPLDNKEITKVFVKEKEVGGQASLFD